MGRAQERSFRPAPETRRLLLSAWETFFPRVKEQGGKEKELPVAHYSPHSFRATGVTMVVAPHAMPVDSFIANGYGNREDFFVQNMVAVGSDAITARQAFLQAIPIFAGLTPAALTEIASAIEEAVFHKGDVIVMEGQPGNRMFIIGSGSVEVVKNMAQSRETVLAVLRPKDFLGEMSIIECVARSASVRAVEDTSLFALKGMDLYRLFQRHPDQYAIVILNIARDISRRLRAIDEKYAAVSH